MPGVLRFSDVRGGRGAHREQLVGGGAHGAAAETVVAAAAAEAPPALAPISHPIVSLMTTMAWRQISARGVTTATLTIHPPDPPPSLVGILRDHNTGKVRRPPPRLPHRRVATRAPAGSPFFFFLFSSLHRSYEHRRFFFFLSFLFVMGNT